MTGRELIAASLRLIGAIAPGETPAAQESTDGLATLNRMLSSWSNEELLIYSRVNETLTLTISDGSYTIGTSGDLNTSRPQRIDEAAIRDDSVTPSVDYPLRLVSLAEWQSVRVKDVDGVPQSLFSDGAFPLETLYLYPRPNKAFKLVLWSWKPISSISTLDTSISLPPGYEEAMIYNLALRLSPEYGRPVSELVNSTAIESKASIKRANHRPSYLRVDEALTGRSGKFNIYTGGSR